MWALTRGATVLDDERVRFAVWAPRARTVEVQIEGDTARRGALVAGEQGLFEATLAARSGDDYRLVLDGEHLRPDPCARWQPAGVHGPSRIVDPAAFAWSDAAWRGLPLTASVIYELHVGTFTPEATFDAVIPRLEHLAALGVNTVELMPVAEFPGARNWGYDGVHLYAPQSTYGGPDALRRLVDACHDRGLAVVLDVVYNHLGPEGNYLHGFAPYFTDRYRTPWGEAVNYDGPDSDGVRAHVVDNARYWFHEYHVDALRLDAIHGIFDFGARPILAELAAAARASSDALGRPCRLIAESDLNDARVIRPAALGGLGLDAQWSDDFHHALHARLTGSRRGYFADFGRLAQLGRALTEGYVYQGEPSRHRRRRHGNDCRDRPGEQFVVFVQNHDQIANACQGRRLASLAGLQRARVAATALLAGPGVPLLFMGEEWAASTPFDYFTSHGDPALARAVSDGRRREHAAFDGDRPFCDPQATVTFAQCILRWDEREAAGHGQHLALYRALLALRRGHPVLGASRGVRCEVDRDDDAGWLRLRRASSSGERACIVLNLGAVAARIPGDPDDGGLALALCSEDPAFGGAGAALPATLAAGTTLELPSWCAAIYLS